MWRYLSLPQVSRVPVEKMLAGLHWVLGGEGGEELHQGVLWGGLKGCIRAGFPWIKPFLCFTVMCDII